MQKRKEKSHTVTSNNLKGKINLYKNDNLIRSNVFHKKSLRKELTKEYYEQIKENKEDSFYITIEINI